MDKKLRDSVKRQLNGDRSTFEDVLHSGADAGFSGFTYYSDTVEFFKKNRAAIIALVKETAQELGEDYILFIANFKCLTNDAETQDEIGRALYGRMRKEDHLVANALSWFALEEAARDIIES